MFDSMRRITLATIALCAMTALSLPASAGTITDTFAFLSSGTTVASGSFSYDSSLQGGSLSYANLSSFNITVDGGPVYDLNYINTTSFTQYLYFDFNTATTSFVGTNITGFPTLIAGIATGYASGFFVGDSNGGDSHVGNYPNPNQTVTYDTISITSSAVPEPSSLTLCGIAGLMSVGYISRRRRRNPRG